MVLRIYLFAIYELGSRHRIRVVVRHIGREQKSKNESNERVCKRNGNIFISLFAFSSLTIEIEHDVCSIVSGIWAQHQRIEFVSCISLIWFLSHFDWIFVNCNCFFRRIHTFTLCLRADLRSYSLVYRIDVGFSLGVAKKPRKYNVESNEIRLDEWMMKLVRWTHSLTREGIVCVFFVERKLQNRSIEKISNEITWEHGNSTKAEWIQSILPVANTNEMLQPNAMFAALAALAMMPRQWWRWKDVIITK